MNFKRQGLAALTVAAIGCGLAGCGGTSKASGVVQAPQAGATAEAVSATTSTTSTTSTTTTAAVKTPTSGPLSKAPVMPKTSGKPPTKLVIKDLVKGTGPVAKSGSNVVVNYTGELYSNDKVFDSSWSRHQTFPFTLGQGAVIKGWDEGLVGMRVGGRRELIIPSKLAYGKTGSGSTIPPNSALVFVVDLLSSKG